MSFLVETVARGARSAGRWVRKRTKKVGRGPPGSGPLRPVPGIWARGGGGGNRTEKFYLTVQPGRARSPRAGRERRARTLRSVRRALGGRCRHRRSRGSV